MKTSSRRFLNAPKYMTVSEWIHHFGHIPYGGLRHLIHTSASFNEKVVKRIGSKVLLDVAALDDWIAEQNKLPERFKKKEEILI